MKTDLLKVFYYGSFMDLEVLRTRGVVPRTVETSGAGWAPWRKVKSLSSRGLEDV